MQAGIENLDARGLGMGPGRAFQRTGRAETSNQYEFLNSKNALNPAQSTS
jgi:hypothetical protein